MALLLAEADVRSVLPMDDLVVVMERVLIDFSAGRAQQPLRTVMHIGEGREYFGVMPAQLADPCAIGTKLVAFYRGNARRGLPTHFATILLFDCETGALLAVIDGRYITEARTGAVSAVATRHLAPEHAPVLAILGSGVQARSHLEALMCVRAVREVRVWSPNEARRQAFASEMQKHVDLPIAVASSAEAAVRGANLIVLATTSAVPVVESDWVSPGAHICAVGACRPEQREMDPALVARARLVVDSRAGALLEAGDIALGISERLFAADHIVGELGEIAAGTKSARRHDTDVTVFKSIGMAVEDVAAAHLTYRRAIERGLGQRFTF